MPGTCRFCSTPLAHTFCDLGMTPLSNSYLTADELQEMEPLYPLHAYVSATTPIFLLFLTAGSSTAGITRN
jgi:hypothetical protein